MSGAPSFRPAPGDIEFCLDCDRDVRTLKFAATAVTREHVRCAPCGAIISVEGVPVDLVEAIER